MEVTGSDQIYFLVDVSSELGFVDIYISLLGWQRKEDILTRESDKDKDRKVWNRTVRWLIIKIFFIILEFPYAFWGNI